MSTNTLLHEGLLELITMVIATRNKMQKLQYDPELEFWHEELDKYATNLNEVIARTYDMLGCSAGMRLETIIDSNNHECETMKGSDTTNTATLAENEKSKSKSKSSKA